MRVSGIDHVNISTQDVEASARFYADVLDLDPQIAAWGRMTPEQGRWLFDHEGQAIIHLRKFEADGSSTGPIDHVALKCSGMENMVARLKARGIDHRVNNMQFAGLKQIFVTDPHGISLELNFTGE